MDASSCGRGVRSAVEQINPMVSRSCPFLDLVNGSLDSGEETRRPTLERFVLHSKAPPAMMHVNQLLFISAHPPSHGDQPASQTSEFDVVRFLSFFTPQSVDFTWAADENILEEEMYEYLISPEKGDQVDDVLRKALLQAAEQLEEQFRSLSPSPKELLTRSCSIEADPTNPRPLDEASIDAAFTEAVEAALVRFTQSGEKSSLQLMEFLIAAVDDEGSTVDFPAKMAIAERIVNSSVPYPEASAGSDALSICLYEAVLRVQSELDVEFPVEALMAAIDRLPADKEVRLLLQQLIIGMIEKPQPGRRFKRTIGVKIKFKVPRPTTGQGGEPPEGNVVVSQSLFWRIVNGSSRGK